MEYGAAAGWNNQYGGMDAMGGGFDNGMGGMMDAGFLHEPAGASSSNQKGGKKNVDKNFISASIKQILGADNSDQGGAVKIDDVTPAYVKICGTIESIEAHSTQVYYMINDTTGIIKCIIYVDKEADGSTGSKFSECQVGCFVRVVGLARTPQTDPNILMFSMGLISDFNEVTNHMLEIIYCHNFSKHGPPPSTAGLAAKSCKFYPFQTRPILNPKVINAFLTAPLFIVLLFLILHPTTQRQLWNGLNRWRPGSPHHPHGGQSAHSNGCRWFKRQGRCAGGH